MGRQYIESALERNPLKEHMNAKSAKRLRRIALGMAAAAEQAGKPIEKVSYVVKELRADGEHPGTIFVKADTFKGAYKALKKGVR